MAPREPTRAQMSSKLGYQAQIPPFLQKLKNRMAGLPDADDDDDEAPQYAHEDDEFEHVGGGRAPIPRRPRPAIPERPADDGGGSADDDDDDDDDGGFADERPQVVVLRAGKHLTAREAEDVRRAERGLPPLAVPGGRDGGGDGGGDGDGEGEGEESAARKGLEGKKEKDTQGLSFSSGKGGASGSGAGAGSKKRKATSQLDELKAKIEAASDKSSSTKTKAKGGKSSAKKPKKESKTLLSFGDDT